MRRSPLTARGRRSLAWSLRPCVGEALERRELFATPAFIVEGTAGPDEIIIDQASQATLSYRLNGVAAQVARSSGDGSDGLVVNAGEGADTIRFEGVGTLASTLNGDGGDDRIIVGDGTWDASAIAGSVSVTGGAGIDSVLFNDAAASVGAGFSLSNPFNTSYRVTRDAGPAVWIDIASAASPVERVTIQAGNGADTVAVDGTIATTPLTVLAGLGDDAITLGNDLDTRFRGAISLDAGPGGRDVLTIDDSADAGSDIYTFAGANGQGTLAKNSGGAAITFANLDGLTLKAGTGGTTPIDQQFRVTYLPAGVATTVVAGGGDDALRIGDGSAVNLGSSVLAPITFQGGGEVDRVDYLDAVGTSPSAYRVTQADVLVDGSNRLHFDETEFLNVVANAGDNTMTFVDAIDFHDVTLDGGAGNDTFLAGNGSIEASVASSVRLTGGAGTDRLTIDDATNVIGSDLYTLTSGLLTKGQRSVIWSTGVTGAMEAITLLASARADTVVVNSISATGALRVDAGDGSDVIQVARTAEGTAPATSNPLLLRTGAGEDRVEVNSDWAGSDAAVLFDATDESIATLDVRAGGRVTVAAAGGAGTQRVLRVTTRFANAGLLDLADQTLIVSPVAASFGAVDQLVNAGFNGGTWSRSSGAAIVSSVAAGTPRRALGSATASAVGTPAYNGVQTSAADTIVRYTLVGDANLDRAVNFSDLLVLAANFNQTGRSWTGGNFNFDATGAVDFNDLLLLASAFGTSIGT